jgi:hypothetical protein
MACNLLSQFVRKNGAAAVDLGLGISKGQTPLRLLFRAAVLFYFLVVVCWLGERLRSDLCEKIQFIRENFM